MTESATRLDWMPLLVDRYLGDTTHLSTEQHGAYLLLLMAAWKRGGALPNDDAQLAAIARMQPARWRASRAVLLAFFTEDGNELRQKRLESELTRARAVVEQRISAGKASAAKRAAQRDDEQIGQRKGNDRSTSVATTVGTSDATRAPTDPPTNGQRDPQRNGRHIQGIREYREIQNSPEAIASAPAAPEARSPKDRLWRIGPGIVGGSDRSARTFLGKLIADSGGGQRGEQIVAEALEACAAESPGGSAKAWLVKACEARAKRQPGDPLDRPDREAWADEAGFATVFEAESAGCGPGNFRQFRDGRRLAA